MTSWRANPVLVGCMSFEYLFVLDHRLREQTHLPRGKKIEIFAEAIDSIFNELFISSVFTDAKVYSEEAVRQIFYEAAQSPSLRISRESFAKFFGIMSMTFKAHMVRIKVKSDLIGLINNQVRELKRILYVIGERFSLEAVNSYRERLIDWFKDMSYGEFSRMLSTLLNATRNFRTPVTILVESKLQAENGKLVLPIGSKDVMSLGHCVLFDGDGTEVISYDLPIAGRNIVDPDFIIGENRFKQKQLEFGEGQSDEEDYARRLAEIYSDTDEEIDYGNLMLADSEYGSEEEPNVEEVQKAVGNLSVRPDNGEVAVEGEDQEEEAEKKAEKKEEKKKKKKKKKKDKKEKRESKEAERRDSVREKDGYFSDGSEGNTSASGTSASSRDSSPEKSVSTASVWDALQRARSRNAE